MKKIVFWRLMIVAIVLSVMSVMSSCGGLPEDIKLNDKFSAFAELDETNDTLWGVKDSFGLVVKPGRYSKFSMVDDVITCVGKDDNLTYAFTQKGAYIGKFEMFTHWTENGDYYLGVKYKDRTFYFPKKDEILKVDGVHFGLKVMFLDVAGKVEVRDYEGKCLWKIPTRDAIVFKEADQDKYFIFAPEDWSKPPFKVYDINGKLVKKMAYPQYRKLIKRATALKAFNTVAIEEASHVLK